MPSEERYVSTNILRYKVLDTVQKRKYNVLWA